MGNEEKRPWADLPVELLEKIACCLPLVELLGFRSVCNDWNSASSRATGQCKGTTNKVPWFLLCNDNLNCRLYDLSSDKMYTIRIPELDGATCFASFGGWLLLYKERSMFFFCPFSRAKINLPQFPHSELSGHVAVFSSSPTSPDCVVCVINRCNSTTLELNLLRRESKNWAKHEYIHQENKIKTITCATFCEGIFNFLDSADAFLTFDAREEEWIRYRLVITSDPNLPKMPFSLQSNYFSNTIKQKLGLEDGSLSTCGTTLPGNARVTCIYNEDLQVKDEKQLHCNKGIWIEPRFFQLPPNQSWSL